MKPLRALAAAAALAAGLAAGIAGPAAADPGDGVGSDGVNYNYYPMPYWGPTCYGSNGSRYIWNLAEPGQWEYTIDSCRAAQLVAAKNFAGNYSMYVNLLTTKFPGIMWPETALIMGWQTSNAYLAQCASYGTGVSFLQGSNGMVLMCRPQ